MAAGKAFAFLWAHVKTGHQDKELQNDINNIIKGTYNDEITGPRKFSTRSTKALGFVKTQKTVVNFQPLPPTLPEGKFYSFWNQMGQIDAVTQFLEALLKRLNELDREAAEGEEFSKRKISRRSWAFGLAYHSTDRDSDYLPGSPALERAFRLPPPKERSFNIKTTMKSTVLNTILLLALYHNLDLAKQSTVRLLEMMKKNARDRLNKTWHQTVLHILSLNQQRQRKSLSTMVGHCAACMSSHISALDNRIIGSGWLYLWLQERALDGQSTVVIKGLLKCLDLIEKDPSTIVTPSHELQIMSLLFMIRAFLSLTLLDETTLSELNNPVRSLMCWPNPVGHHAIETFNAIMLEQKAPGHALRHRFMLSDVRLSPKRKRGKRSSELRGSTYVVLNITCQSSSPFQSLLHCSSAHQEASEEIIDTKLLISLLMLARSGDGNAEAAIQAAMNSWLWQLPASIVSILYDALLEVMEDASQVEQVKEAMEIRKRGIVEIWRDLEQAKMLGQLPELIPKRELLSAELLANRIRPINFVTVAPEPKWRPVCTKVIEVHAQPGPMLARYSRTGAEELLMDIIMNSPVDKGEREHDSSHSMKEVVRLLVGGGDGTLHYILAGYVGLTYAGHLAGGITTSGACHSIDMLFYLLPLGQNNTLATYIAQRDLWYDATIYRPLVDQLPMIPHIGQSRDNELLAASTYEAGLAAEIQPDDGPTPSKLLTRQIQNYILEANCLLKVSIYNCEGWYNDGMQNYHCTIPFLLRAEMGLPAASVSKPEDRKISHQQSIPRRPLAPLDEDSLEIFSSNYYLQAEAIFRPIDWTGKEGEEKRKVCSFVAIQAINVPKPCEMRLGSDPCSHFLDICLMDSGGLVKKVKDMDDIINCVSTYRANWLMVEAQDTSKPFDVLLDGELYGPFYRIRLSSCPHPSNRRYVLKFPVMTYWPTQVSRASC